MEPLTIEAFVDILALDINSPRKFDPDWRMPDPEDILRVCSSLITITSPEQGHNRYVKLAHSSIKDYLLSDTIPDGRASEYAIDCSLSHSHIATACLCYLSSEINNIETTSSNGRDMQSIKITYPLAEYAARYWTDHLGFAGAVGETICSSMIELFQPAAFRIWSDIWIQTRFKPPPLPKYTEANDNFESSRLTFATEHGLSCLVQRLLKHGVDPDSRDVHGNTALQVAGKMGYLEIAEILLKYGADPNAPPLGCGTRALCSAALSGCDEVVNLLLDHGAEINMTSWLTDGRSLMDSPLACACGEGHSYTVELLISKGADVNVTVRGITPLSTASWSGHIHVVELLIAHGAGPNSHGPAMSALHCAASQNNCQIAKALIGAGANVDALDEYEKTPLHSACFHGSVPIAELLLSSGAHVNAIACESTEYISPLTSAVFKSPSLVELLLAKGAKVVMPGQDLIEVVAEAQWWRATFSKIAVIKLLLQWEQIDIDRLRSCGKALHAAYDNWDERLQAVYENGDKDLIQFLIDYTSNVIQNNESNIDSSQNAGIEIQSKILKLLIDAGPKLGIPDDALPDALETALCGGHASLARKLLAKGLSQDVDPRYTVQLKEVLTGKNMLTEMEPGNIEPYWWLSSWTHSTNETRRALFPPWILAMIVSCRCHGRCRKRSL